MKNIDLSKKYQYPEVTYANARIEELEAHIKSLLATVEQEHAGKMAWKKTAGQKDAELITLQKHLDAANKRIASAQQQQEPVLYQIKRRDLDCGEWGDWSVCSASEYDNYFRIPESRFYEYAVRKLYAEPGMPQIDFPVLSNKKFASDYSMLPIIDAERMAEGWNECLEAILKTQVGVLSSRFNDAIAAQIALPEAPASKQGEA